MKVQVPGTRCPGSWNEALPGLAFITTLLCLLDQVLTRMLTALMYTIAHKTVRRTLEPRQLPWALDDQTETLELLLHLETISTMMIDVYIVFSRATVQVWHLPELVLK